MKTHSETKSEIITGFKEGVAPMPAIIEAKIDIALNYDPLDIRKIKFDITGDKVILSGTVDMPQKMHDVVYAVWEAPGVDYVENNIQLLNSTAV